MSRARWMIAIAFAALLLCGCGAIRANFARQSALEQDLDAYVIQKPLKEVWESVTLVNGPHDTLFWNGVGFTWKDDGPWHKKTSSRTSKDKRSGDDQTEVVWFECEGNEVSGGSQVRYVQITETTTFRNGNKLGTDRKVERRVDLELELVARFDAKAAKRIKADGEHAARSAN